jgi:uncharacterized membrane protein YvlD (DUF360 family)
MVKGFFTLIFGALAMLVAAAMGLLSLVFAGFMGLVAMGGIVITLISVLANEVWKTFKAKP